MRRLKWIPLTFVLGLIIILDPTHTPAQPGGKGFGGPGGGFGGGGKGGRDPESRWAQYQQMTGGNGDTLDLSKLPPNIRDMSRMFAEKYGAEPLPPSGIMTKADFMAFSARNSAKIQSAFGGGGGMGGPQPFGPPGGAPGGAPGGSHGGPPTLPPGGGAIVISQDGKGDLKIDGKGDGKMEVSFDQRGGGGKRDRGGFGGGPPGGGPDMRMNMGGGNWDNGGGGGWNWGNNGGENGNGRPDNKKETEEQKPVAMRYGHLPKDLPEWFDKYDIDKDGQIALWEWRKAGEDIAKFQEMDLNGDGLVTADELLRFTMLKSEQARIDAINNGDGTSTTSVATRPSGRPGKGGNGTGGGGGIALPGSALPSTDKGAPTANEKGGDRPGPKGQSDRADRPDRGGDKGGDRSTAGPWANGGKKGKN
jgi:hypothetical protein